MDTIKFSDIVGKRVTTIKSGSELFLACALDKYAQQELNASVTLKGVAIDKHILNGAYFAYARRLGIEMDDKYLRVQTGETIDWKMFYSSNVFDLAFEQTEPNGFTFNFETNPTQNREMHGYACATGYLSLVAACMVLSYRNKAPFKLTINHKRYSQKPYEYSDLMVCMNYGNMLVTPEICDLQMMEDTGTQPDWEAFVIYNQQRGYMQRKYIDSEKLSCCSSLFEVGDVAFLFSRKKGSDNILTKEITGCVPVMIEGFDENGIKLVNYASVSTKLTYRKRAEEQKRVSNLITYQDTKNNLVRRTVTWSNLGVAMTIWDEELMLVDLEQGDTTVQWFNNGVEDVQVECDVYDTVYAIFAERDLPFDKERFKNKYFKGRVPVYEMFEEQRALNA